MDSKNKEMRVHLILALLAMSIIMALGLGKAKAAEKEVTLYVYYEGDEALHINIWNWTGIKVADGAAYSNVDFGDRTRIWQSLRKVLTLKTGIP